MKNTSLQVLILAYDPKESAHEVNEFDRYSSILNYELLNCWLFGGGVGEQAKWLQESTYRCISIYYVHYSIYEYSLRATMTTCSCSVLWGACISAVNASSLFWYGRNRRQEHRPGPKDPEPPYTSETKSFFNRKPRLYMHTTTFNQGNLKGSSWTANRYSGICVILSGPDGINRQHVWEILHANTAQERISRRRKCVPSNIIF